MSELDINKNTGVIALMPSLTDWVASGETGLSLGELNPTGDWRSYMPTGERQKIDVPHLETNACVTFSATDVLETGGNFMIAKGHLPADRVQWLKDNGYIDATGSLNFSDRFTAKMSGTDPNGGNSLVRVWDSIRHDGLVPESKWPFPIDEIQANPSQAQSIYYQQPSADVIALGKKFAELFDVQYEWVAYPGASLSMSQFTDQLTKTPIQIVTATCPPWNTDQIIKACGPGSAHATAMMSVDLPHTAYEILDHYVPFVKRLAPDYTITYAMRGVLLAKLPTSPKPFSYTFRINLQAGAPVSGEVRALQQALQTVLDSQGKPYMKVGVFGAYGPQTTDAVDRFQRAHQITDPVPGAHFGPQTRIAMNAALASMQPSNGDSAEGGGLLTSIKNMFKSLFSFVSQTTAGRFVFVSSADPDKWSLTVKSALLGAIPFIMQAIGIACGLKLKCIAIDGNDLNTLALTASNLVYLVLSAWAGFGVAWGLLRKIAYTMMGENAAL